MALLNTKPNVGALVPVVRHPRFTTCRVSGSPTVISPVGRSACSFSIPGACQGLGSARPSRVWTGARGSARATNSKGTAALSSHLPPSAACWTSKNSARSFARSSGGYRSGPRRRPSREEAPSRRERHGLGAGRPRDTAEDGDGPAVASGDEDDRDLSLKDDPQFSDRGPWYSAFRSPMMRRRDPEELRRLLARLARQIPKKPSAPSVRRFAIRTSSR